MAYHQEIVLGLPPAPGWAHFISGPAACAPPLCQVSNDISVSTQLTFYRPTLSPFVTVLYIMADSLCMDASRLTEHRVLVTWICFVL